MPGALSQEMVATRRVRTPARRYDPSADAGRPQWTRADAGGDTDGSGSGGGDDSRRRASSARMASSPGVAASPRSPSPATARADWRQESDVVVADDASDSSEPASDVSGYRGRWGLGRRLGAQMVATRCHHISSLLIVPTVPRAELSWAEAELS